MMHQVLHCDWLRRRENWGYLARSRFPALCRKKWRSVCHINPLLTKLLLSRWLDIGLDLFLRVYDLDSTASRSINRQNLRWPYFPECPIRRPSPGVDRGGLGHGHGSRSPVCVVLEEVQEPLIHGTVP